MATGKISAYLDRRLWDSIESRLTKDLGGPVYVGVDGASDQTVTATCYHQGAAVEHLFRLGEKRATAISVTELGLDGPTITGVVGAPDNSAANREAHLQATFDCLFRNKVSTIGRRKTPDGERTRKTQKRFDPDNPESIRDLKATVAAAVDGPHAVMLCEAARLVKASKAARQHPRHERDLALAELMLVHGWSSKADIYRGLGVHIARSDLDILLDQTSLSELPGYPNGQVCAEKAIEWEGVYRQALLAEETAARIRNALVRGFAFEWYGTNANGVRHTLSEIAAMAGVFPARVNQICRRDYPEYRAELKAARGAAA